MRTRGCTFEGVAVVPDEEGGDAVCVDSAVAGEVDAPELDDVKIGLPTTGAGSMNGEVVLDSSRVCAAAYACAAAWMAEIQRALSMLSSAASRKMRGGLCWGKLIRNTNEGLASEVPSSVSSTRTEESIGC